MAAGLATGETIERDGLLQATRDNADWLNDAPGKAVKMIYSLLPDLPQDRGLRYDIIFLRRDLNEILRSQRSMLQRNQQATGLPDDQMKRLFQRELEKFDRWISDQSAFRMLNVNYSQLVFEPHSAADAVNEFLGGCLDTQEMAAVVDRSLCRNRAA